MKCKFDAKSWLLKNTYIYCFAGHYFGEKKYAIEFIDKITDRGGRCYIARTDEHYHLKFSKNNNSTANYLIVKLPFKVDRILNIQSFISRSCCVLENLDDSRKYGYHINDISWVPDGLIKLTWNYEDDIDYDYYDYDHEIW